MKVLTAGGAGTPGQKEDPFTKPTSNASSSVDKAENSPSGLERLEYTRSQDEEQGIEDVPLHDNDRGHLPRTSYSDDPTKASSKSDLSKQHRDQQIPPSRSPGGLTTSQKEIFWLFVCFLGIMMSFVCYGLLLEYTTSGGRKLHELSFLFVTSALYTVTGWVGRYVVNEDSSDIPPSRFALLGLSSMGSTFCSVRSLRYVDIGRSGMEHLSHATLYHRYVIFPIQVLAKVCLVGTPWRDYRKSHRALSFLHRVVSLCP